MGKEKKILKTGQRWRTSGKKGERGGRKEAEKGNLDAEPGGKGVKKEGGPGQGQKKNDERTDQLASGTSGHR